MLGPAATFGPSRLYRHISDVIQVSAAIKYLTPTVTFGCFLLDDALLVLVTLSTDPQSPTDDWGVNDCGDVSSDSGSADGRNGAGDVTGCDDVNSGSLRSAWRSDGAL